MRLLLWLATLAATTAALGVAILATLLWLTLDTTPQLQRTDTLQADEVAGLKQQLKAIDQAPLTLSAEQLDRFAQDATQRLLHGSAHLGLQEGAAELQLSLPLAALPLPGHALRHAAAWRPWLNLRVILQQQPEGAPRLVTLHMGRITLPGRWVEPLVDHALHHWAPGRPDPRTFVQQLNLHPTGITLQARSGATDSAPWQALLLPPTEQLQLRSAVQRLALLIARTPQQGNEPIPLMALLQPLLHAAGEEAALAATLQDAPPADATAAAYRSALLALTLYATGQPWERWAADAAQWHTPAPRPLLLNGREDFAQHFLLSALIATQAGGRLADLMGLYKELSDTRDGSGFSFNDLAADRAGTRFGQHLVHHPAETRRRLATGPWHDSQWMPDVSDLPEFLSQADFTARYGRPGSPAFDRQMADIERRLDALPTH